MPTLAEMRPVALVIAAVGVLAFVLGSGSACSLVVETQDRQCESDDDCKSFEGGICDVEAGVCVARVISTGATTTDASSSAGSGAGGAGGSGGSSGTGCVGEDGCFACEPESQAEFLNHCTDAQCVPYDNSQIADLLDEDGSVPPLP